MGRQARAGQTGSFRGPKVCLSLVYTREAGFYAWCAAALGQTWSVFLWGLPGGSPLPGLVLLQLKESAVGPSWDIKIIT